MDATDAGPIKTDTARERGGKPWSAGWTFLMSPWLPSTTVKRTRRWRHRTVFLFHFLSALLAALVIFVLVAWEDMGGGLDMARLISHLSRPIHGGVQAFRLYPYRSVMICLGITLAVEIGFLVIALFATPWGARDEPWRRSFAASLRALWLRTPAVITGALAVGMVVVVLSAAELQWWRQFNQATAIPRAPSFPTSPTVNPNDPAYAKAMADYRAAVTAWSQKVAVVQQQRMAAREVQPWYLRASEPLIALTVFLALSWWIWGLLRSVGTERCVSPIARDPLCEACGYNLTTMAMNARCPECGEPVLDSLGPDVRQVPVWSAPNRSALWSCWWHCARTALLRPQRIGRQVRLKNPGTAHRLYFALHLPAIFLVGEVSIVMFAFIDDGFSAFVNHFEKLIMIVLFGVVCVLGAVAFTLFGALLIAGVERLRMRRNLLPGAMQIACYLAPYLVAWAIFGAATGLGVVLMDNARFYQTLYRLTGIHQDVSMFLMWFIPNLACGLYYLALLSRGTIATRYANR